MNAAPKPAPRAMTKAATQRRQATADRAVYAAVTARDIHCRACGAFSEPMERHHIVPRSRGGKTTRENVIVLCRRCHQDVHAKRLFLSGDADAVAVFRSAAFVTSSAFERILSGAMRGTRP